jgi:hypothetical protein
MKRLLVLLLGSTLASGLFAAETEMDRLRAALAERLPNVTPDRIAPSPVPGLYELVVGTQVVYITPDARLALQGRLLDLEQGTDLTEPVVSAARLELLAGRTPGGEDGDLRAGGRGQAHPDHLHRHRLPVLPAAARRDGPAQRHGHPRALPAPRRSTSGVRAIATTQ